MFKTSKKVVDHRCNCGSYCLPVAGSPSIKWEQNWPLKMCRIIMKQTVQHCGCQAG